MSVGLTFYAVRKDALPSAPAGVRKFIDDFFEEREILGIPCMVAISSTDKSPWYEMDDKEYEEGLTEEEEGDCGVFSWLNNHPEAVFEYYWS